MLLFAVLCGSLLLSRHARLQRMQAEEKASPSEIAEITEAAETETHGILSADEETAYRPAADQLNLAVLYPEDADRSDALHSYAGHVYARLMREDSRYIAKLYDFAGDTPREMAERLGIKPARVLAKYNPEDDSQDKEDPASWYVPDFQNVNFRFYNADGEQIRDFSNVKAIMAMANVYCYYHDYRDAECFEAICEELYRKSRSYKVSIGSVYFDEGCMHRPVAEETAVLPPESGKQDPTEGIGDFTAAVSEETTAGTNTAGEEPAEIISMNGARYYVRYGAPGEDGRRPLHFTPVETAEAEGEGTAAESDAETVPEGREAHPAAEDAEISEKAVEAAAAEAEDTESSSANAAETEHAESASAGAASEECAGSKSYCPGHIDLNVSVSVCGAGERKGLRALALSSAEDWNTPEEGAPWKGWTEENLAAAERLLSADWYRSYGLSISSLDPHYPLGAEEISAYLSGLPQDISAERRALCRYALDSVGRVPYYWGGKAEHADYAGNNFGSIVSESDERGRILRGLDCSGWVQWIYWSALGMDLGGVGGTGELVELGKQIRRSELRPGDLVIRTGTDSHVVLFLQWTQDGRMLAVHENADRNNVSVDTVTANYPYYRSLLD